VRDTHSDASSSPAIQAATIDLSVPASPRRAEWVDRVFDQFAAERVHAWSYPIPQPVSSSRVGAARILGLALGSVIGTIQDTVDEFGANVGLAALGMLRPVPTERVRNALTAA
jgi:pyruvate/2-oxoacid:ferredoxin oxidoreductase alpha subunit